MINVEVTAKKNESPMSVLKRFSSKARSANVVKIVRDNRFKKKKYSRNVQKKNKIAVLRKTEEILRLIKLGKFKHKRR